VVHRIPIHTRSMGTLGRDEEKWSLLTDSATGDKSVCHEWSNASPYGRGPPWAGEKIVSVEEFLASDADAIAKAKLRNLIARGPDFIGLQDADVAVPAGKVKIATGDDDGKDNAGQALRHRP
jgi:hypothetical protein